MIQEIEKIEREGFGYKNLPKLDLETDELVEDFAETHKIYKYLVQEILEDYDKATNNDFILFIESLRTLELCDTTSGKENFIFKIKRKDIKKIPSPESITRARRSLNAKGIGLPTDKRVLIRRGRRQATIRKYFKEND